MAIGVAFAAPELVGIFAAKLLKIRHLMRRNAIAVHKSHARRGKIAVFDRATIVLKMAA